MVGVLAQIPPLVICLDMRFVGVIPARYRSARLPGKPLIEIAGRPLIQWVYEQAAQAKLLHEVVVATDDEGVFRAVMAFGGKARMTRPDHLSGTDRVAEIAHTTQADVFINIQGDEPTISPLTIDKVCLPFQEDLDLQVATARVRMENPEEAESPHVVKVVVDECDRALYFSRAPIPYPRRQPATFYKHLGIYGYRRDFLLRLGSLKDSRLEKTEGLEQLRFLENGVPIRVVEVLEDSIGVDTREDLERVRPLLENTAKKQEIKR